MTALVRQRPRGNKGRDRFGGAEARPSVLFPGWGQDAQYPEIELVVQRRFLSSLKDEIIEMLEDFPE